MIIALSAQSSFSQDGIQYKNIKIKKISCDVGILYKRTPEGMDIEVSAIATGKGIDFRTWEVTDIKLSLEGNVIRSVKSEKFYFTKQSFFQGAAPLVFAAIGAQYKQYAYKAQSGEVCPVTGETKVTRVERGSIAKGIDKAGMAAGLGLLASQAKGEITGLKCIFGLDKVLAEKVGGGKGAIKINLENRNKHQRKNIKVDLAKLYVTKVDFPFDYDKMSQDDLLKLVNIFEDDIRALEKYQKSYRYNDPEYGKIQSKIKQIRAERDKAYKIWSERKRAWIEGQEERIADAEEKLELEDRVRTIKQKDFEARKKEKEQKEAIKKAQEEAGRQAAEEAVTTEESTGEQTQAEADFPTKEPDWVTGGKAAVKTVLEGVGGGPVPIGLIDIEYEIYDNWNDGIRIGIAQQSYLKYIVKCPGFDYLDYKLEDFAPPKLDGSDAGIMWRWWEKEEYK